MARLRLYGVALAGHCPPAPWLLVFVGVIGGALWWMADAPAPAAPFAAGNNNEDMPIMISNDNLDMYADMDFYQWLETQDQPAPAPAARPWMTPTTMTTIPA